VILLHRARQRSERSGLKGNFDQPTTKLTITSVSWKELFCEIRCDWRVISLTLCAAFALAAQDMVVSKSQTGLAQVSPDTTASSITNLQGIGLTASHKQITYDSIANEQEQTFSGDPNLSVGNTIPDSLTLNAMPIAVKDQIGLLKDFRFVKLAGDNILIVDPATRKIMDIATKQEAGR
jgi:hypothetical protein